MKARDIVLILQAALPNFIDLFTDSVDILNITRSDSTVTVTLANPINFKNGDWVNIVNSATSIQISTLSASGTFVTAVTTEPHDLTMGFNPQDPTSDQAYVQVSGAEPDIYNGQYPLINVPNQTSFVYEVDAPPEPATQTGDLIEQRPFGYDGRFEISAVSPNQITYQLDYYTPPDAVVTNAQVKYRPRIARAVNLDAAINSYTAQKTNKLWAYVVSGDCTISKSAEIKSDAYDARGKGDVFYERLITDFSVYVFCPATNDILGGEARDTMEDVRTALFRSLLKAQIPDQFSGTDEWSTVTYLSDSFSDYKGGFYIHRFTFAVTNDITDSDCVQPDQSAVFKKLFINYKPANSFDTTNIMESEINLDG